jgi:ferredoxin
VLAIAVTIDEKCITCGACEWECPTNAILPGDPRPIVEAAACTECYGFFGESQCVVVCPADAISVAPEPVAVLESRFRRIQPSAPLQDTWIWRRI